MSLHGVDANGGNIDRKVQRDEDGRNVQRSGVSTGCMQLSTGVMYSRIKIKWPSSFSFLLSLAGAGCWS